MRLLYPVSDTEDEEVEGWQERGYQKEAHDAVFREFDSSIRSTLLWMPTGTGKTFVAGLVAKTALSRGWKTLFLAHREILVSQAAATLEDLGLKVAVEMGEQDAQLRSSGSEDPDVVVATVQTLQGGRLQSWNPNHFGLVITDECHRAAAPMHQKTIGYFDYAFHLGITATPEGASGQIGIIYKSLAYHYKIERAIQEGFVIPPYPVERCQVQVDLRDMKSSGGDFNATDLAERISPATGTIADAIRQRIGDRYTVVFTPDVRSAAGLAKALESLGISARHVAGSGGRSGQRTQDRRLRIDEFNRRAFQVIICCDLLFEGWDAPHVSAVVIARPTLVCHRFAQMVGRGTRLCPEIGKTNCLVVDLDWKTDSSSRELITAVDFWAFDDSELKEWGTTARNKIVDRAKKLMDDGMVDPRLALEQAKKIERERIDMPLWVPGTKAEFAIEIFDPLNVAKLIGLKMVKRYDYAGPRFRMATDNQIWFLTNAGIKDAGKLSMIGASKLIGYIKKRDNNKLTTYRQVDNLVKMGIGRQTARDMSREQADKILSAGLRGSV